MTENSNRYDTFDMKAHILKSTLVDLIISRDSIKKFNLFSKVPSQLGVKLPTPKPSQHAKCSTGPCDCQSGVPLTPVAQTSTGPVIRVIAYTIYNIHTVRTLGIISRMHHTMFTSIPSVRSISFASIMFHRMS